MTVAPNLVSTIIFSNVIVRKNWITFFRNVPICLFLSFDDSLFNITWFEHVNRGSILCFVNKKFGYIYVKWLAIQFPVTPHAIIWTDVTSTYVLRDGTRRPT